MNILEYYYKKVIKYDLINKFYYNNLKELPELKKIILSFGCRTSEIKILAASVQALNLISQKHHHSITTSKHTSIFLKIRKGQPIGCKIILEKKDMYNFFLKLLTEIFPILKDFKGIYLNKNNSIKNLSFTIKELITFKELETHFYLFNNVPPLNITLITNTKTKKELIFLLNSFKIPLITKQL